MIKNQNIKGYDIVEFKNTNPESCKLECNLMNEC